jgi:tRNA1(Val) A37 N6-methylase TrmN6
MAITFDLDQQITELERRHSELQGYNFDASPSAPSLLAQQTQITVWLASLDQKLIYLRNIRANRAASMVVVNPPTAREAQEINEALNRLLRPIQQNQAFASLLRIATGLLDAVGTLGKSC